MIALSHLNIRIWLPLIYIFSPTSSEEFILFFHICAAVYTTFHLHSLVARHGLGWSGPESNSVKLSSNMSATTFKELGNIYFEQGKFEDAIAAFTKAMELDPTDHRFYSNRSAAYLSNGDADLALIDAEKCIEINPDFAKGYSRKEAALLELSLLGEMMELRKDAKRGRFVIAKTRLNPCALGLEVLEEQALIIVPPPSIDDETICGINPHSYLGVRFANYLGYMKQTAIAQQKIMGFYKEMDCPKAMMLRNELNTVGLVDEKLVEEIVAVDMAFEFNAVVCCPATSDGSSSGRIRF